MAQVPAPALYVDLRGAVTVRCDENAVRVNGDPFPLHRAAARGDVAAAVYHIRRGASADERDGNRETATQIAQAMAEGVLPQPGAPSWCGSLQRAAHYSTLHACMGGWAANCKLAASCKRLAPAAMLLADAARQSLQIYERMQTVPPEGKVASLDHVPALLRRNVFKIGSTTALQFCRGYILCLMASADLLAEGKVPAPGVVVAHIRWITSASGNPNVLQDFKEYVLAGGTVEFALDAVFAFACGPAADSNGVPDRPPATHPLEHFDCLSSVLLGPSFESGPHPLLKDAAAEKAAWQRVAYPISHRTDYVSIAKSLQADDPSPARAQPNSQQPTPPPTPTQPAPAQQLAPPPPPPPTPPLQPDPLLPKAEPAPVVTLVPGGTWATSHNMRPTGKDGVLYKDDIKDNLSKVARFFGWAGVKSREAELSEPTVRIDYVEPAPSAKGDPQPQPISQPKPAPVTHAAAPAPAARPAYDPPATAPQVQPPSERSQPQATRRTPFLIGPGSVPADAATSRRVYPGVVDILSTPPDVASISDSVFAAPPTVDEYEYYEVEVPEPSMSSAEKEKPPHEFEYEYEYLNEAQEAEARPVMDAKAEGEALARFREGPGSGLRPSFFVQDSHFVSLVGVDEATDRRQDPDATVNLEHRVIGDGRVDERLKEKRVDERLKEKRVDERLKGLPVKALPVAAAVRLFQGLQQAEQLRPAIDAHLAVGAGSSGLEVRKLLDGAQTVLEKPVDTVRTGAVERKMSLGGQMDDLFSDHSSRSEFEYEYYEAPAPAPPMNEYEYYEVPAPAPAVDEYEYYEAPAPAPAVDEYEYYEVEAPAPAGEYECAAVAPPPYPRRLLAIHQTFHHLAHRRLDAGTLRTSPCKRKMARSSRKMARTPTACSVRSLQPPSSSSLGRRPRKRRRPGVATDVRRR